MQVFDISSNISLHEIPDVVVKLQVCPVIALNLFVEWLQLLLVGIFASRVNELLLSIGDVRSVQDHDNLGLCSAVGSRILELEDAISILTNVTDQK